MTNGNGKLLGQERLQELAQKALSFSSADQTQVTIGIGQNSLTRFAGSIIHQNVAERDATVAVRAIIGKKIGFAVGNSISDEAIKATVEKAIEFARHQQENPDFVSLPKPKPIQKPVPTFFDSTAEFSADDRAAAVEKIVKAADKVNAHAAGSLSTGYSEHIIANSLGINAYDADTSSTFTTVITADTGFGYAQRISSDITKLDIDKAADEAAKTADRSRNPEPFEPGEYDVVLTPYCVEDMVSFLSWMGFSALAVQEGRSFMSGKFGQKICGDNITIWDDGLDPRTNVRPFDGEGFPKQKVELIKNGVANAVVYDSYTAYKEGKESTGHAMGGTGTQGPYATNMFLAPGNATVEEMIASTDRGIFVTRFNYTNIVHPLLTIFTGLTRDGTFLIENGKITKPIRNLRFTESILDAFSNVEMIGKDLMLCGAATVPALKIKNFRFTGATEF
ncbi:MAG TPA: TldD/PmbA family protein [Armatimonadota bacterium]|nr:TldD/PmbA family protein [Armatimonadota bacterium]